MDIKNLIHPEPPLAGGSYAGVVAREAAGNSLEALYLVIERERLARDAKLLQEEETKRMKLQKRQEQALERACPHRKNRHRCKLCKGREICMHDKLKYDCNLCSTSFCSHGKKKYRCRECGGSSICTHGKERARCVECGGSSICIHKKVLYSCKECYKCHHNNNKRTCQLCKDSAKEQK